MPLAIIAIRIQKRLQDDVGTEVRPSTRVSNFSRAVVSRELHFQTPLDPRGAFRLITQPKDLAILRYLSDLSHLAVPKCLSQSLQYEGQIWY